MMLIIATVNIKFLMILLLLVFNIEAKIIVLF